MIQGSIQVEASYHTIIVMRTKEVTLARRFPHTIFTHNDKISYAPEEKQQQYQFNVEMDAVKYKWDGKKLVLGDFSFVQEVFNENGAKQFQNKHYIYFWHLKNSELVEFYLYTNNKSFVRIYPLAVIKKTLLFMLGKQNNHDSQSTYKEISLVLKEDPVEQEKFYHFSSQFGLLSDQHFINNFIRGHREYSSYYKDEQSKYRHIIDPCLYRTISELLPTQKL